MPVEYRPVAGHAGYRVGSDGSVWSRWVPGRNSSPRGPWRKMAANARGDASAVVTLRAPRGGYEYDRVAVAAIVLTAFVGPRPPGGRWVFRDGDLANLRLSNLSWRRPLSVAEKKGRHRACVRKWFAEKDETYHERRREKTANREKQRYAGKLAAGICSRSGCARPAEPGRTSCATCLAKANERAKARFHRQKRTGTL